MKQNLYAILRKALAHAGKNTRSRVPARSFCSEDQRS